MFFFLQNKKMIFKKNYLKKYKKLVVYQLIKNKFKIIKK